MRDLEQVEERITRAEIGATELSDNFGGLMFSTFGEALQFANIMSSSKGGVPKHLRGDTGACLRIVLQAAEWRMSPYGVADKSYFVNDKIAFESQLIHAVVESRSPLQKRLRCSYDGEGPDRVCICTGYLKGEVDPLVYTTPKFRDIKIKNSPLWTQDPDQQLWYYATRAWARRYVPDVLLGIYSRDELEAGGDHTGPDKAKDVTPKPSIKDRLNGAKGRGFDAKHIEREASAAETGAAKEPQPPAPPAPADPETGEIIDDPSPADAYRLGCEARTSNQPRLVPPEVAAMGEPFADAWQSGWTETDEIAAQDI